MTLCNKYGLKNSKNLILHSIQELVANESVEIIVRLELKLLLNYKRSDLMIQKIE